MKRVLIVLMSVVLVMSLTLPGLASGTPSPALGTSSSVQGTNAGFGTYPSGNPKANMTLNEQFTVIFENNHFTWLPSPQAVYNVGSFNAAWIKYDSANFSIVGTPAIDGNTGRLSVTFQAKKAGTHSFYTYLDSVGDGTKATNRLTQSITVTDPASVKSTIGKTVSGGTAPYITSHSGSSVSLNPGQTMTFRIPANNFEWTNAGGTKDPSVLPATSWIQLSGATIGTDFNVAYGSPVGDDLTVVLTSLKATSYSKLQVYMRTPGGTATTYSNALQVTVSSAGSAKISGISSSAQIGGTYSTAYLNGKAISYNNLDSLEVGSDDELLISLDAGFFTWDGTTPYEYSAVTTSQLNTGKIKLGTTNKKGSSVFDKIEIVTKNGRAYIKVKFVKNLSTTKDVDYSITLYLSHSSKRDTGSQLVLAGEYVVDVIEVDSDDDYVDLSDGSVIEVNGYVRNMEIYLGNGVTMWANLTSGKKYSGTAEFSVSSSDEKVLDAYPSIEHVIVLTTKNLSSSSNKVSFDFDENYYVYNADGKYIGRSNTKLPYSSKYYLSTKQIALDTGSGSGSGTSPVEEVPPVTVPAVEPPANNYDNPGTGRAA